MNETTTQVCKRCGQIISGQSVKCAHCDCVICGDCAKELSVESESYYCPGCHGLAKLKVSPEACSA